MTKSLRRILGRLRSATKGSATTGRLQKKTSTRGGLQQPQRIEAVPVPARVRS
jgi:hypothetical protein